MDHTPEDSKNNYLRILNCFRNFRDCYSNLIMAEQKLGFFESFMLSGVAAGVSKTAAAPIERVKLLVQNQDEMIKQVSIQEVCYPYPIPTLRVVLTSHTMECLTAPSVCWRRRGSTPSGEVDTESDSDSVHFL